MSIKPIKKSEQKILVQKKLQAKKRKTQMSLLPPRILIISEGTKTEPYYMDEFARRINEKYTQFTKNKRIIVDGTGRNTTGLYEYLDNCDYKDTLKEFDQIWLVYDKDDFPKDRFDNTAFKTEKKNSCCHAAWSNESFELWLVWHFQDYTAVNGRKDYIKILKKYISDYKKGSPEVYSAIIEKGNVDKAIQRSKKQIKYYTERGINTPSQMHTASTVYKLIEELRKYM